MTVARSGTALLLSGALTACSFAPVYKMPDGVPPAGAYRETGGWKAAQPLDGENRGPWWTLFQDEQLNALEARLSGANQDLQAAFARLQQARAGGQ
jgi:outer membrane protein TolC